MTKRERRILTRAGACLALFASLSVTPTACAKLPVAPAAGYGFGDGAQLEWLSPSDVNRELDAVAATSATWLRVLVPWSAMEPVKGQYDWSRLDVIVDAASARHLRVLGVIAFSPGWARPADSYVTSPPDRPADYADFASAVVKRYGSRVSDWQLWNEPNLPMFFGYASDNSQRYTELVKAAYPAIKAAQPNGTVVLAGLSRLQGTESPPEFLKKMYAGGAEGSFDAAAAHPYVFPGGLAADPENGWSDVGALHGVMVANGDGGKKIWMTEMGAPTCDCPDGVTPDGQSEQILAVLAAAASTGYSGPAFIYSIRDTNTTKRGDRESNFGSLLTSDWQPKVTARLLAR